MVSFAKIGLPVLAFIFWKHVLTEITNPQVLRLLVNCSLMSTKVVREASGKPKARYVKVNVSVKQCIKRLIRSEIDAWDSTSQSDTAALRDFEAALREPHEITVNFSGGFLHRCWSVTFPNGDYRVVYVPSAGCFSLCAESDFGPLDIGVHGSALGCFLSV